MILFEMFGWHILTCSIQQLLQKASKLEELALEYCEEISADFLKNKARDPFFFLTPASSSLRGLVNCFRQDGELEQLQAAVLE